MVTTWTPEMAARRLALVRRSLGGALPAEERAELGELTQAMNEQAWARLDAMPDSPSSLLAASARGGAPGIAGLPACRECGSFEACEHDAGRETENAW
jgi:hypothetical protein